MRRLIVFIGLELYALALALVQLQNGVRTDEAKYLLNIPYPHPPFARWFLSLFDGFAWQEVGARILFATLMVQAVWLVWDMGRYLSKTGRLAVAVLWLGSAAFILQTGTIMMAPLTALQALVLLWILSLPKERLPGAVTIAFLWLLTLFTALQGILLAPLAVAALRLKGESWGRVCWYIGAPIVLVGVYVLTNPLIPASALLLSDAGRTLGDRMSETLWMLLVAGSGIGTIVGIIGLILKKHWFILASFLLVVLYVFMGGHDYYAILFLPFFVTGTKHLLRRVPRLATAMILLLLACTALVLTYHESPFAQRTPAREVLEHLGPGTILLKGSMGHEWQYEALPGQDILLYTEAYSTDVDAIVCYDDCEALETDWVSAGSMRGVWLPRNR